MSSTAAEEGQGTRSPSIFPSIPVISISRLKKKKKIPGDLEGLNPLPAVCLSISHAINPNGVISLDGAPLMRCPEREREGGRRQREE